MSLQVVEAPSLSGPCGIAQLKQLQADMFQSLARGDYVRVRQLDKTCAVVLDGLLSENRDNKALLVEALADLKAVYRQMLIECNRLAQQQAVG